MVRDRLNDLRKNCGGSIGDHEINIEVDPDPNPNSIQHQINVVLNQFSELREDVKEIQNTTQLMRNLVYPTSTNSFRNSKDTIDTLEKLRQNNLSLCSKVFQKMKDFECNLPDDEDYTTLSRVKRTNYYCIRENFIDVWRKHEHFLMQYEEKIKKDLMRQAKLIDANITEEETESLIANNTTSLFVGNILEDTQMARQKLRDLLVRHSELAKIEKSLTEVRDMFLRISTLVMEQNTMIQVIEYHAQRATIDVDKGNEQLEKARDLKIKRLKRKSCILIWVAIILTILIVIAIIL